MEDQLKTSKVVKSQNITNATFLAASLDGPTLFDWLDGQNKSLCGPEVVHASHIQSQGINEATPTSGTSGLSFSGSSESAALSLSLANRLQVQFGTGGSMEYRQTWKRRVTPSGRVYWEHTASGHRTFDSVCTGWPMPKANEKAQSPEAHEKGFFSLMDVAQLAGWSSPTATDGRRGSLPPRSSDTGIPLDQMVQLVVWETPMAHEARLGYQNRHNGKKGTQESLTTQVINSIIGVPATSSHAVTENSDESQQVRKVLNPAFGLWLMGFPQSWMACGIMGCHFIRSLPRKSKGGQLC